jgi:hypothetical protein
VPPSRVTFFNRRSPDRRLNGQIVSTWPFWRSPQPSPAQLNILRSIRFHSVPEIVELILIKTHLSRQFGFSHLKRDIAAMAHDLRADLDQLLFEARQRPILYGFRRRQRAEKIAKILGECIKPRSDGVGGE